MGYMRSTRISQRLWHPTVWHTTASSPLGRSWNVTFDATTREEAEQAMLKQGYASWEWQENGDLSTTTVVQPALATDPRTKQTLFFNSIVAAFVGWKDERNDPHKAVTLGNGDRLN